MENIDLATKEFILKIFRSSSLLEELSTSSIKDFLTAFTKEYDLSADYFEPFLTSLPDRKYFISDLVNALLPYLKEILKTLSALQKLVESCFSENNLKNNLKLRNIINEASEGFVPLSTFLRHKNIKSLTTSEIFLSKALEDSSVLELSQDRRSIRLLVSLKSNEQDVQVFYYNLDTSQTQITYSSIAEGLLLKGNILSKNKKISMIAGNSRVICYFKPDIVKRIDLVTGEDKIIGQAKGLSYMEIKSDEDLLVGIIDKSKIFVVNLQTSVNIFEHRITDGQVEKVVFHPTEKNLLGRFFFNEVVLFRYTPLKNNELVWFKVVPVRQKILNIALTSNLLAAAVGQGQILVINTDTDMTVASYTPHTYNTLMYSSNITLHFITPKFLLTSGRSQNEFCLTKIDSNEKVHVLSIQSLSRKNVSVNGEYILITDPLTSNASLVIISECDGLLKFSKIIDYKLDSVCSLACLNSLSNFVIATKSDCRYYPTNIEIKSEERLQIDNNVEANEIISTVNSFFVQKFKNFNEKTLNFTKLINLKKNLQDSVTENIEKSNAKEQKNMQEDIKKQVSENILNGFKAALEEILTQTVQCTENGIKEFEDKESELNSVYDILHKENYLKVTTISDFTDIYAKICMRKLKKLEKVEEAFKEKQMTLKNNDSSGVQEKINILLAQGDFESALSLVVSFPNKLYAVLSVINPYGLFISKRISTGLYNRILKQFLIFPPTSRQLINSAEWLECLLKFKNWNSNEKEQAKGFLRSHPLGYLVSVIK